jgi:hypothetical protein
MSVMLCHPRHIDVLVAAACEYGVLAEPTAEAARALGQELLDENERSVAERYAEDVGGWGYRPRTTEARLDPLLVLRAIHFYDCQSCEAPGYDAGHAAAVIAGIKQHILEARPDWAEPIQAGAWRGYPAYVEFGGFDRAPWGFNSLEQATA